MTTGKAIGFTRQTFVDKVMSLLFKLVSSKWNLVRQWMRIYRKHQSRDIKLAVGDILSRVHAPVECSI